MYVYVCIDDMYTIKLILGKNFRAPSRNYRNRTHDLPVTSLDALTTELWVTHVVSRSQAWRCKSQDITSSLPMTISDVCLMVYQGLKGA